MWNHKGSQAILREPEEYEVLMGLDDTYVAARGQILLIDLLLLVNQTYSHILQDEKPRNVSSATTATLDIIAAFAVRDSNCGFGRASRNLYMKCDKCDMIGHIAKTCRSHLKCGFCNLKEHIIDTYQKPKKTKDTQLIPIRSPWTCAHPK